MDVDLLAGYHRFRDTRLPEQIARYKALNERQPSGLALVIACADSRVSPSIVFDAAPGEIFTVRNVANMVPPFEPGEGHHGTSAAIEFAVKVLKVRSITVLGHGGCGGCAAALDGLPVADSDFLGDWISLLAPARERLAPSADPHRDMEHETVKVSLENLLTFPFVAERVAAGTLELHGAWFAVGEARLERLDPISGTFLAVD